MSATLLIGVDYSAQEGKVGLAAGRLDGDSLKVEFAKCPGTRADVEKQVIAWINEEKKNGGVLLAIDAPLGWPKSLSKSLCWHKAGRALSTPADRMFMRETDRQVCKAIGKTPLKVGADKIAIQAHSALSFLNNLRNETGRAIPLAWKPGCVKGISAIEVYPAATLKERGLPHKGYRKDEETRMSLVKRLAGEIKLSDGIKDEMMNSDDVLDAVVCVLAAADFAKGNVISPEEAESDGVKIGLRRAKKEGWIWVRKP